MDGSGAQERLLTIATRTVLVVVQYLGTYCVVVCALPALSGLCAGGQRGAGGAGIAR